MVHKKGAFAIIDLLFDIIDLLFAIIDLLFDIITLLFAIIDLLFDIITFCSIIKKTVLGDNIIYVAENFHSRLDSQNTDISLVCQSVHFLD